jgi:aldehyde:ferredoxin oxidoreductase
MIRDYFRVLTINLTSGKSTIVEVEGRNEVAGGSGLAALLFNKYGQLDKPWDAPEQPLIFTIGPLTGYFPLMSKTVCAFKSPYHNQYAESHAGGRSALALRFADLDGVVITGKAVKPVCISLGSRHIEIKEVHYLFRGSGHRSILRIGPAGERGSPMAGINADTYRHFGRLGGGAVMGVKKIKGIAIQGDAAFLLPDNKDYPKIFEEVHKQLTDTDMMSKYHDIGTPINVLPLNKLKALPVRNLQQTSDPNIAGISGEKFAEVALLRNNACSGCPVGCIHIGFVRERFAKENRYLYRQVAYDHEPIFATGSMLGVLDCFKVLDIIDVTERMGLDVMSGGVALAWATEALEKGIISESETIVPLKFGDAEGYKEAMRHLGMGTNEFYQTLSKGTMVAAERYSGKDFACVLGQEMAGYATGEVYFTSQALGFRHSHLDSSGYSYDQKTVEKNAGKAADFLVKDEQGRVFLTSMLACLFARGVYNDELLSRCLNSVGYNDLAGRISDVSRHIQKLRWRTRFATGFDPRSVSIPKRFTEIVTWKGAIDEEYLQNLRDEYSKRIIELSADNDKKTEEKT